MSRLIAVAALALGLMAGAGAATNAEPVLGRDGVAVSVSAPQSTGHRVGMGSLGGCRRSLGCGCNAAVRWLGLSAQQAARQGYNAARGWLGKGVAASPDCIGCFMVSSRGRRGGHVGKVVGRDTNGNPIVESYANARLGWTVATYPKGRVLGYRDMGWTSAGR